MQIMYARPVHDWQLVFVKVASEIAQVQVQAFGQWRVLVAMIDRNWLVKQRDSQEMVRFYFYFPRVNLYKKVCLSRNADYKGVNLKSWFCAEHRWYLN